MKRLALMMAAFLIFVSPATALAEEITPSITVQGSGRVTVTPDLATISFAVTEENKEAGVVQKAITDKANAVKDAVIEEGLPEYRFSTSGIQLYTNYDYSTGVEKAVGYRGQISMSIKEISVDEVGKYLQILSKNGVNQIDGISVFYSGYEEAYNEALGKAMVQARQKAETLAAAEKARVTDRFTVTEGYQDSTLRGMEKRISNNYEMAAYDVADMGSGNGLGFSVGTSEVEAVVTVCYAIETGEE